MLRSIKAKIMLSYAATVACILLLTLSIFVFMVAAFDRNELIQSKSALVRAVASTSQAPLLFNDAEAALEILAALGTDPDAIVAELRDAEGVVLAEFTPNPDKLKAIDANLIDVDRVTTEQPDFDPTGLSAIYAEPDYLSVKQKVSLSSKNIGELHVRFDTTPLQSSLTRIGLIAIAMLALASILATIFAISLNRYITSPLRQLAGTMEEVSSENNYKKRLDPEYSDELGELILKFNTMLEQIDIRDSALELIAEEANSANKAKSLFLANMSHEIRTPLNGVLGMTEMLLNTNLDAKQRSWTETIHDSGDMLLTIVNDVLDFSKIEAGKLELEETTFVLNEVIDNTVAMLAPAAEKKQLSIKIQKIDTAECVVIGDPNRLRQVLTNIIGNAIKFTEAGEISLATEKISRNGATDIYRFTISDEGIGIASDKLEKILNPFTQADESTTREFGGTGLGLAISNQIIIASGGKLEVISTLGQGSSFVFEIPYEKSDVGAEEIRPLATTYPATGTLDSPELATFSGNVLVVEDNLVNQTVAQGFLETLGLEVTIADSGADALKILSSETFDLILMDCQMPEMDGYETTRIFRRQEKAEEETKRVPVIAATADVQTQTKQNCLKAGMDDYMGKPYTLNNLANVLSKWLYGH